MINETYAKVPIGIFSMVLMPNHWHFVVRPDTDHQVSEFFQRLGTMHTMRFYAHYHTGGTGHLYQGRFKSFPVQQDDYLLRVLRYVERNALRANLVSMAEEWRWGTAYLRGQRGKGRPDWLLTPTDPPLPRKWRSWVNKPQTEAELAAIRHCIVRGAPYGDEVWRKQSAARLGLGSTLRSRGRPPKSKQRSLTPCYCTSDHFGDWGVGCCRMPREIARVLVEPCTRSTNTEAVCKQKTGADPRRSLLSVYFTIAMIHDLLATLR